MSDTLKFKLGHAHRKRFALPYQRTTTSDDVNSALHSPVLCKRDSLLNGPKRNIFVILMGLSRAAACGGVKYSFTSWFFHRRPTPSHIITLRRRPCMTCRPPTLKPSDRPRCLPWRSEGMPSTQTPHLSPPRASSAWSLLVRLYQSRPLISRRWDSGWKALEGNGSKRHHERARQGVFAD